MTQKSREKKALKIVERIQKDVDKLKSLNYGLDSAWDTIGFFDMTDLSKDKEDVLLKPIDKSFTSKIGILFP